LIGTVFLADTAEPIPVVGVSSDIVDQVDIADRFHDALVLADTAD
jgi:hypothetical protein